MINKYLTKYFKNKVHSQKIFPLTVTENLIKSLPPRNSDAVFISTMFIGTILFFIALICLEKIRSGFSINILFFLIGVILFLVVNFVVAMYISHILYITYHFAHLLLHGIVPGKTERINEAKEFWELINLKKTPAYSHDLNDELRSLGVKNFCAKYLGKTSPGLLNCIQEAAELERSFLPYLLSIPKLKDLSVDSVRKIILAYPSDLGLRHARNLETCFKNYSLQEIESIFTKVGNKSIIKELDTQTVYPVVKHFSSLIPKPIPPKILAVDNQHLEGYTFRVLKNKGDYDNCSNVFSNCVRSRWGGSCVIVVAEHMEPDHWTCIEISASGTITQMAGPGHLVARDRKKIMTLLQTHFNIKTTFSFPRL